tara:strand:+ start:1282 stop:1569 length:288 start_codon:yes stop_codon:yes gene_type:complete
MIKKTAKKVTNTIKDANEAGARRNLIEELFYDLHRSRRQIYWLNFVRGIFFGVGSVIGGTLVVALAVTILGLLVDLPGGIGEFIEYIVDTVRQSR